MKVRYETILDDSWGTVSYFVEDTEYLKHYHSEVGPAHFEAGAVTYDLGGEEIWSTVK